MNVPSLTDEELAALRAAASEEAWNRQCDAVKRARSGQYPPDWYAKVVLSGLASATQGRFR